MKSARFILAWFLLGVSFKAQAIVNAPTAAAAKAIDRGVASLVTISDSGSDHSETSDCSGIFISDRTLLTAAHCVSGTNPEVAVVAIDRKILAVPVAISKIQTNLLFDLAVLTLPTPSSAYFAAMAASPVQVGEIDEMRGFGSDQDPNSVALPPPETGQTIERVASGAALFSADDGALDYRLHPTLMYAVNGDSGGPIFNSSGRLVGILKSYEVLDSTDQWGNLWIQNAAVDLTAPDVRNWINTR